VPDYDRIFGFAGYRLERKPQTTPDFGFASRPRSGGLTLLAVEQNGAAAAAGLRVNDVITKLNGEPVLSAATGALAGKDVRLTVTRGGEEIELPMKVGSREFTAFSLVEMPQATPQQTRVREGWLKQMATAAAIASAR